MTSFTVETFNGHDNTQPVKPATFVGLQERGAPWSHPSLQMWYPPGLQEAMGWNPLRFKLEARGRLFLHDDGVSYGHPDTTPQRWALWIGGTFDGDWKLAVIDTHLVNNAFGVSLRGERRLRRKLWRIGWRKVRKLQRQLEAEGYDVFVLGDLNRTLRFWQKLAQPLLSSRYDHVFYPAAAQLIESWTGDANGSDHRPLFGRFRKRAER